MGADGWDHFFGIRFDVTLPSGIAVGLVADFIKKMRPDDGVVGGVGKGLGTGDAVVDFCKARAVSAQASARLSPACG